MSKTIYLTFEIHLTDAARVAALQAAPPGETSRAGGALAIIRAPDGAKFEFGNSDNGGVPLPVYGPDAASGTPPVGVSPYMFSEWFSFSNNYPYDAATFVRHPGGFFGWLFGKSTRYYWRGVFVYDPPKTGTDSTGNSRAPMPQRRWVSGFYAFEDSLSATTTALDRWMTRDASRTVDGYGFAMRGELMQYTRSLMDYQGGGPSTYGDSWERLYLRLRKLGTAEVDFWRCQSNIGNAGVQLNLTPSGQISIQNVTSGGGYTLLGATPPLVIDKWTKIDIILSYPQAAPDSGRFALFVNGVGALDVAIPQASGGMGTLNAKHTSTKIGSGVASGWTMELDIGYWHNAGVPTPTLNSLDFEHGSRAVLVRPKGFASANAGWTGDWRLLLQKPVLNNSDSVASTTALATLAVVTDWAQSVKDCPGALGVAAFVVHKYGHRGTTSGTLGYKIGAAAPVLAAVTETAVGQGAWTSVLYRPTGMVTPTDLMPDVTVDPPVELHHVKGNDANSALAFHLMATAEVIGTFGEEDYPPHTPAELDLPLPFLGVHNSPYPHTPWARTASPPLSPVVIQSGTYVGNGTGQDLIFRTPVHWLSIRRVTAAAGIPKTTRWWSSMLAAHPGSGESPLSSLMPDQLIDPTFVVAPPGVPTGVGALPDRSVEVAGIVNANLTLLDGNNDHKRDLVGIIVRDLNANYPADGNNWGLLQKPTSVAADILVWKPTLEHVDVLTDTGPMWNVIGVIDPSWSWLASAAEGQQATRVIVRISGAHVESNENGSTYVYVGICDPGQRFMTNGTLAHRNDTLPLTQTLRDTLFTPLAGWFHDERVLAGAFGVKAAFKGPGNAAASLTRLDGVQMNTAITFGAGSLSVAAGASINAVDHNLAYALFRMDDGSGDPGVANVVRIVSYVGNGAAGLRAIGLPPVTGKRPLAAWVIPNTGGYGYFKDATHTAGNATSLSDGSQLATAIVSGAADEIDVGVTLNANGVTYNVFVIVGGAGGGADGFSVHGEFIPVDPTSPGGGGFGIDPEAPTDVPPGDDGGGSDPPGAPGGGDDNMDTDLAVACLPFTTRAVNIALSHIGVDKVVANLATELSKEALLGRLHYAEAVESTLRDFPWPFATRYATLALLGGSVAAPVNRDWTYSYRRPSDCIFERRIVVVRAGAVNPSPPPFALSYDGTGGRIFTNQANAILEYTARPECSAGRGDSLFREALAWKLASRLAGPLSRNAELGKHASDQYLACIQRAIEVLRPGNPGPRTVVDPLLLDTGTGAAAANVAVVNRALVRIGARTIANLDTEQSREAEAARVIFEDELRSTLRDYPWAFATKYETALALVAGTATVRANGDWGYSYRSPSDAVFVRRIVNPSLGRVFDPSPASFRNGNDAVGGLFYTNTVSPVIEYTARIPSAVLRADALFRDAFAWRLAASLAPSLAQVDPDGIEQQGRGPQERPRERKATEAQLRARAADAAWRMYYLALATARIADANEAKAEPPGDASWITGRD